MLIPSAEILRELRSSSDLLRVCLVQSGDGHKASLVLKTNTLVLKYFISRKAFRVFVYLPADRALTIYAIRIEEGDGTPTYLWSTVESEEELDALRTLLNQRCVELFLFNEVNANVCWSEVTFDDGAVDIASFAGGAVVLDSDDSERRDELENTFIRALHEGANVDGALLEFAPREFEWKEVFNHYITDRLEVSTLAILTGNEGSQQEELALWLIDALKPDAACKNPRVLETTPRELSDLLLTYPDLLFLIESKSLTVLDRPLPANREKLSQTVVKHVQKGLRQLEGGCNNIAKGLPVTDSAGKDIDVPRQHGTHCVVLIPDLGLLDKSAEFGAARLIAFTEATHCFAQILDVAELASLVGAAIYMSQNSERTSPIMAFDALLYQRWRRALELGNPNFEFRVRISDAQTNGDK